MRESFLKDVAFELGVEELQEFIRIVSGAIGWSPGVSLQKSPRCFQRDVSGSILMEHLNLVESSQQWGWKGSRGQIAGLERLAPFVRQRAAAFSCVVFKAPFLLLDFGLLFVWQHIFISFPFFFCLWLNYSSQGHGAVSDCNYNSLSTAGIFVLSSSVKLTRPVENWSTLF